MDHAALLPDVPARLAFQAAARRWDLHRLSGRLWSGDPGVWASEPYPAELENRLAWLRLPETMRPETAGFRKLADDVAGEGVEDVVLLGMGGSSLAPQVFGAVFGPTGGRPRLSTLDSTHPEAVADLEGRIDPGRSLFVVSSKSGTTLETLSFFRRFWAATGGDGSRFVAVTDPGTPLQRLAEERGFRKVVVAPPGLGGRFSALSPFGLVPAALAGVDVEALLAAAAAVAASPGDTVADDPAVPLGLAWGTLAAAGRDKLTFVTSPALAAFPMWLEQLVAESLGKTDAGIVPVAGEPLAAAGDYGDDRVFVSYTLEGDAAPGLDDVELAGHPVVRLPLKRREDLAAEMLRAEVATAAAGEILGVHPFNQPNVEAAKELARQAMSGELDLAGIEGASGRDIGEALRSLLDQVAPGDYVAVQAYLPPSEETDLKLTALRVGLRAATGAATTVGYGPRFLHSTGQLHKGGPNTGVFLQIVDTPAVEVEVPETGDTFGRLIAAQAAGDYQALRERGRRVLRVDVGERRAEGLEALTAALPGTAG